MTSFLRYPKRFQMAFCSIGASIGPASAASLTKYRWHSPHTRRRVDISCISNIFRPIAECERKETPSINRGESYPSFSTIRLLRSEEHTSELQSLMRISYAVFCLKKKTSITILTITHYHRRKNK